MTQSARVRNAAADRLQGAMEMHVLQKSSEDDLNEEDVQLLAGSSRSVQSARRLHECRLVGLWIACAVFATLTVALLTLEAFRQPSDLLGSPEIPCWNPEVDLLNMSTNPLLKLFNKTLDSNQGLAYDEEASTLWEIHTHGVRVFSISFQSGYFRLHLTHSKAFNLSTDFPPITGNAVGHIGGIDFVKTERGRELWLSVHTTDDMYGALVALDADTLAYKELMVEPGATLDWVAIHPHTKIGYFGSFRSVPFLRRFNVETLDLLDSLNVTSSKSPQLVPQYIQSAGFDQDLILNLVGDDYQITLYRLDAHSGQLLSVQSLLTYTEIDGLTFVPKHNKMLAAYNRYHSREKTAKMHSIIQGCEGFFTTDKKPKRIEGSRRFPRNDVQPN